MQAAATTPGGRLAQPRQAAARSQFAAGNQAATTRSAGSSTPRRTMERQQQAVTCGAAASQSDAATKVVDTGLPRTAVVGVLGGGQLGKMMAQEAVSGGGGGVCLCLMLGPVHS